MGKQAKKQNQDLTLSMSHPGSTEIGVNSGTASMLADETAIETHALHDLSQTMLASQALSQTQAQVVPRELL